VPDIEIFGALKTEDVIAAVSDAPYRGALTIVRNSFVVIGADRSGQSFLRVYATGKFPLADLDDLILRLNKLAGVETVALRSWHPHAVG